MLKRPPGALFKTSAHALRRPYNGPYIVLERRSPIVYVIQLAGKPRSRSDIVGIDLLKPYHARLDGSAAADSPSAPSASRAAAPARHSALRSDGAPRLQAEEVADALRAAREEKAANLVRARQQLHNLEQQRAIASRVSFQANPLPGLDAGLGVPPAEVRLDSAAAALPSAPLADVDMSSPPPLHAVTTSASAPAPALPPPSAAAAVPAFPTISSSRKRRHESTSHNAASPAPPQPSRRSLRATGPVNYSVLAQEQRAMLDHISNYSKPTRKG